MKELRDIKLDLLMGNQNPIVDLFNKITDGIKIINTNVYNNYGLEFIYFVENSQKEDGWIFYQDVKNEEFWCNYSRYWSLFESNFDLEYEEIQRISKFLVEEALKREVSTPRDENECEEHQVEEALKREVGTPSTSEFNPFDVVEEALKREVGTPEIQIGSFIKVEEALKREVN